MKLTTILALAGLATATAPLTGQTTYNPRVAAALTPPHGKFQAPLCALKGDFRSSSAATDLKVAVEGFVDQNGGHTSVDTKKYTDGVIKAQKAATDALAANPQNAAGWYYLGRADLQLGDVKGADSSLTKAEALAPDCAADIKGYRQTAWVALLTPSTEFMRLKESDSALYVLRDALTIARYYPQGFFNLGGTFMNMGNTDSALYYFKIAQEKSADPQFATTLKPVTYDLAYIYQQKGDNANAIIQYRKYLAIDSTDVDVKRALAAALRSTGNTDEANKLQSQLAASGSLTPSEMSAMAVQAFKNKDYAGAADGFQKVLAIEPFNHDAIFNLANSYFAMNDGKKLIETAQRLLTIDPLSLSNVQLLATGYRLAADTANLIDAVGRLQAIPTSIKITSFSATKDGAKISGTATGNPATTPSGKTIPASPTTLVFEFLDSKGNVVASQDVAVPALAAGTNQDISAQGTGAGITAWRYHEKK